MAHRAGILLASLIVALVACATGDNGQTPNAAPEESPTRTEPAADTPDDGGAVCSGSAISVEVPPAGDVPAAVANTRNDIIQAALSCDYQRLEELALSPSGSFQYSRTEESAGPEANPAEFWRNLEQQGERPLASLVEILITNPAVQPVTEMEGPGTGSEDSYYNYPGPNVSDELARYSTSIASSGDWIFFLGPQ